MGQRMVSFVLLSLCLSYGSSVRIQRHWLPGLFLLLSLGLLTGCNNPESKLHDALEAYDRKEIDKALKDLEELVEDDYAPAKHWLAHVIHYGLPESAAEIAGEGGYVLKKDYPRVKKLLTEVLEQDAKLTANLLAETLICEAGPNQRDYDQIIHWRRIAGEDVKKGWAMPYADELSTGHLTAQDLDRAVEIYEHYAGFGYYYPIERLIALLADKELSQDDAARLYQWAALLKRWKASAFETYQTKRLAAFSESEKEQAELILALRTPAMESDFRKTFGEPLWGWSSPPLGSGQKTLEYLQVESAQQNPLAQVALAEMHLYCPFGGKVNYDDPKLHHLLRTALDSGHPRAKYLVGLAIWLGGLEWPEEPLSLWLEAADAGLLQAQDLLAAGYGGHNNLVVRPPIPADPVQAYFWSVTAQKNYLNRLDEALQQALKYLSPADAQRIDAELADWATLRSPGYPLLFNTWPSEIRITASVISVFAVLVLIYLSFLTLQAGARDTKNLAVSSVLFLEALIVLLMITSHGLPSNWTLYRLADTSIQAIGPIVILLVGSYLILAGQFTTPLTSYFGRNHSAKIIACASVLGALLLPLWSARFFTYGFDDRIEGISSRFIFPDAAVLASAVLIVHIYMLVNLIYLVRTSDQHSDEAGQVKAFLLAYILRFALLGTAILTFVGGVLYSRLVDSSGLSPSLQSTVLISYSLGELVFGILFSLGILRQQIFGIERLFKRNLVRIALFGFVTLGFLVTEELLGNFVSDAYGTAGGFAIAIAMLTAHRPFTDLVRAQIDRWLPDIDLMDDDASKVYAHQFALAIRDGELSSRERSMLNLTAKSLGLNKAQVARIEETISMTR